MIWALFIASLFQADAVSDIYYFTDFIRLAVIEYNDGNIKQCDLYNDPATFPILFDNCVEVLKTTEQMDKIAANCNRLKKRDDSSFSFKDLMSGSSWRITGTKWCGPGNDAEEFNDLGTEMETDKCCRSHDLCFSNIHGKEEKHGLKNPDPFTRTHCDCDEAFEKCLQEARTKPAKLTGEVFFNTVGMQCFREDYPSTCVKKELFSFLTKRCSEYKFDTSQPKKYQFFDNKKFKTLE